MIYSAIETQAVIEELTQAAEDVSVAAAAMGKAQAELLLYKASALADARREAQDTENAATMAAYGAGALSGKNEAERKTQLAAYLSKDKDVQTATQRQRIVEVALATLEADVEQRIGDYKAAAYRLTATRAKAELMRAMLDAGREPESEGQSAFEKYGF